MNNDTAVGSLTPQVPASFARHDRAGALTIFRNARGLLTKRVTLDPAGRESVTTDASLWEGDFRVVTTRTVVDLAANITRLSTSEALAFGLPVSGALTGAVVTNDRLGSNPGAVARTKDHFRWSDGAGWLMLDLDVKGVSPALRERLGPISLDRLHEVLVEAVPALDEVPMLSLPSAGAFIYRTGDRAQLRGLTGARIYLPIGQANRIPEFGTRLHERLVLAGYGFAFISKAGTVHVRSLIDTAVWSPERLDFIAGAECGEGLMQDRGVPRQWRPESSVTLDDKHLPSLNPEEREQLERIMKRIREDARADAEVVRAAYAERRRAAGHRISVSWSESGEVQYLDGTHEIELTDGRWVTVDEILADPAHFHGQTCSDPLEPDYADAAHRIAKLYTDGQTSVPVIWSFAHGGVTYILRQSAQAAFDADQSIPPDPLPPPPPDQGYTDMGNGGRFARRYRQEVRFVPGRGWLCHDGMRWAPDTGAGVQRRAKQVVRSLLREAATIEDDTLRKALTAHARRSEADVRLRAMVAQAQPELTVPIDALDADPMLFNVLNGTIDLRTGTLLPHDPKRLITKLSPVVYDQQAKAPRWGAFLDRIFAGNAETIGFFQRALGYSLTGDTSEQVFFVAHGNGQNGKSVAFGAVERVLADYAFDADFSTFVPRRGTGPRNDIAAMVGARFVAAIESEAGERLDESVVKRLTGGDPITARFLHKEFFTFKPQAKIWLVSNFKPAIRGSDFAMWRRVRLVPFAETIPEEERDPNLLKALEAELPGILAWMVEGALAWQRQGLGTAPAVRDATEGYRVESDIVARFLRERCVKAPEVDASSTELYSAYGAWCQASGELTESQRDFNERLAAHDPSRVRRVKSNGRMIWRGVELLPAPLIDAAEPEKAVSLQ